MTRNRVRIVRRLPVVLAALAALVGAGAGCVPSTPAIGDVRPGLPDDLVARAEAGDPEAQYRLGRAYDEGVLVRPSPYLAAHWLRRAAEQGHAAAAARLGTLYFQGRGLPRDLELALSWYRRAAEAGDPEGMAGLALMLVDGLATGRDPVRAFVWASLAAEAGNEYARRLLERRIVPALTDEQLELARRLLDERRGARR